MNLWPVVGLLAGLAVYCIVSAIRLRADVKRNQIAVKQPAPGECQP